MEQDLRQTRLFTYDHFLMVESDPRIEQKIREKVMKLKHQLQMELIAFFQS